MSEIDMNYDMLQAMAENPELHLTAEEQQEADECYKALNLSDSTMIIEYGSDIQKSLSELSERMLLNLNSQNIDDIGDMLNTTVEYLKDIEEEKGLFSFLKKTKHMSVSEKYHVADKNVDELTQSLQQHQIQLMKDCAMLSQIYYMNTVLFRALNVKIVAAKRKLEDCKNAQLPALTQKDTKMGGVQATLTVADKQTQIDRLEKKIYELELTRNISLQSAPLITHILSNQETMAEKIQSVLLNTIPLWKNQVIYALSMEQANQAAEAENEINRLTDKRLLQNMETLKLASVETIQTANSGFANKETLNATNKLLIENLDEVARIRQEKTKHNNTAKHELVKMKKEI